MSRPAAEIPIPSLPARIRNRRIQLGLTGGELAERAGISTSYVSLIETGARVPDAEVAAGLARALGDDEALYRAWARAARLGLDDLVLLRELERVARTPAYSSLVESGQELPPSGASAAGTGEEAEGVDLSARLRDVASRLMPERSAGGLRPDVVGIPVLAEGADPGGPASRAGIVKDWLFLDRRLIGKDDPRHLFAYEVTADAMKHLGGLAAPGDRIVFRQGGAVAPDRICAVRTGAGIVIARVLLRGEVLLLLPGAGGSDFDTVAARDPETRSTTVAGTHVLLIRH